MSAPIQGGEAAIRHHRAQLTHELDELEQQVTRWAHRIRNATARAELLRAAIAADTTILNRLEHLTTLEARAAAATTTKPRTPGRKR